MILLPIGRDEAIIRRHAWVCYVIIALNVLLFAGTSISSRRASEPMNQKFEEILDYLAEKPYLTIPPEVARFLPETAPEELRRLSESMPSPSSSVRRAEQNRVDEMARDLGEMIDRAPGVRWAFVPANPSFDRFLSSIFMHADFWHLLGNMMFLFATGPYVEDAFGRPAFALLYFTGAGAATLAHMIQNPESTVPLVGASGAIAAVMGAYLIRFLRSRMEFAFIPIVFRPDIHFRFFVPAFVFLPGWFLLQIIYGITDRDGGAGVAFWAHVGGFAWGIAFAVAVKMTHFEARFVNPLVESQTTWRQSDHVPRADRALALGDLRTAEAEVRGLLEAEPDHPDGHLLACRIAREKGDPALLAVRLRRLFDLYMRRRDTDMSLDAVEEFVLSDRELRLPADVLSRAARIAETGPEPVRALEIYDRILESNPDETSAFRTMLLKARTLRRFERPEDALEVLEAAEQSEACTGEWKQAIDDERRMITRFPKP